MTQTNEELLRNRMYAILSKDLVTNTKTHNELVTALDEIMSLIPQPEQLEVKLKYSETFEEWDIIYHDHDGTPLVLESRITENDALDFCKRFNLKVVEV